MRNFFLGLTAVAFAVFGFSVPTAFAQPAPSAVTVEEVRSFSADIAVREDGTVYVAERIEYAFPESRHGIYRDIPVRYDREGTVISIPVRVLGVAATDGTPIRYQVQDNGNVIRVKIGDPDLTVTGVQTYVISYEVRGAVGYFADHDELYWNVTGLGWTVPIRRASATVRVPESAVGTGLRTVCYTGPQGSTASDCVHSARGGTAFFAANEPLTIVVGWEPGVVAKLLPQEFGWFSFGTLWPLFIPLVAFVLLWGRWSKVGRDPKGPGAAMVQYDPPDGLTPAETGTVADEKAEAREIVATIVDLAVRGYLTFTETTKDGLLFDSKDIVLHGVKDGSEDPTLKPFEKRVLSTLFGSGMMVTVSQIKERYLFEGEVQKIQQEIDQALIDSGHFPKDIRTVPILYGLLGAAIGFIGVWHLVGAVQFYDGARAVSAGAFLATGIMTVIFGFAMVRKTEKGVQAKWHAMGFKEYLAKAEKYRLQWQEKEGIFEKFLPYAMVFGVADKWSKAFEGFDMQRPEWYQGSGFADGHFNAALFAGAMNSIQQSTQSAVMSTKPQKSSGGSGFGGGGSSGGGGGGGGGGSW